MSPALPLGLFGGAENPDPSAPPVRVVIDTLFVHPGHRGMGRFQARLVEELAARYAALMHATLLVRPGSALEAADLPTGWDCRKVPARLDVVRSSAGVLTALRRERPDVFLTSADRFVAPPGLPVLLYACEHPAYRTAMATIAGVATLRSRLSDALTVRWFERSLARADAIVTESTSTARDVVFFAGADPRKVSVAMPGPFVNGHRSDDRQRRRAVLAFVDRDPRDNGPMVVEAFSAAPDTWTLDIVGNPPPAVAAMFRERGLSERVTFHGRASDDVVVDLYQTCSVLLDLSLYEGFGSQPAEATAFGMRGVVSGVTSLPETVQGAPGVDLVNPHAPERVRAAVRRALATEPVGATTSATDLLGPPSPGGWDTLTAHLVATCQRLRAGRG